MSRRARALARLPIILPAALSLACGHAAHDAPPHHAASSAGRATVTIEPMDAPAVLMGLRGHEAELRACFRSESGTTKSGFVKLRWEVSEQGRADKIDIIGSSVGDEAIEHCLMERVSTMSFGAQVERMQAHWTFVYRLPKLPGVDEFLEKRHKEEAKRAKKRKKSRGEDFADDDEAVQGLSIEPSSKGSIDPDAIEEVVHTGYRLFAHCYRDGIERDASLGGVVRLRFVIDDVGEVTGIADSGSELPDQRVLDCVAEGIFALEFPAPREGDVKVVYRIVFDSG